MIELHVAAERTPLDRAIEDELVDLVVAHTIEIHEPGDISEEVPGLPAIQESGTWVASSDFDSYMSDLRSTLVQWRKFQTDACYIEDDGTVC